MIIGYASEFGRLPSEVYADYLDHRRDYDQVFAYRAWKAERENAEYEKGRKANKPPMR